MLKCHLSNRSLTESKRYGYCILANGCPNGPQCLGDTLTSWVGRARRASRRVGGFFVAQHSPYGLFDQ